MTTLGIVAICVAIAGLVYYNVRQLLRAESNAEALEVQNQAQRERLEKQQALAAASEKERRQNEKDSLVNIDADRAGRMLEDAFKDNANYARVLGPRVAVLSYD